MKFQHTIEQLDKLELPPTPKDMRLLVIAMVRDNEIASARAATASMLATCHVHSHLDDDFYYWLGVSTTLRALTDGAFDRWRRRSDLRFQRTLKAVRS